MFNLERGDLDNLLGDACNVYMSLLMSALFEALALSALKILQTLLPALCEFNILYCHGVFLLS